MITCLLRQNGLNKRVVPRKEGNDDGREAGGQEGPAEIHPEANV